MQAGAPARSAQPPGSARWLLPAPCAAEAESLRALVDIDPVTARVLYGRGFRDASAIQKFLHPSLDDLHDPLLMRGMPEAIARIRAAIAASEKILIYGDYDVDGTTSVVILRKAIELAGGAASFHIPNRLTDGYGMRPEVVERAHSDGVSLIVSVDTGIRAGEVVRRAAELGIDVIVTDHHLPESTLPPALAVLNPNRGDCPYPDKNLCGVGVAFKLVQALLATLDWPADKLRRTLLSFLKLAAIGTVADVVPLLGENRIIVRHGLGALRSVKNPGLKALLKTAGLEEGGVPSAGQIAFRVAPRINAAGRMDTANAVIELLVTGDLERAQILAQQLDDLNAQRQRTEVEIVETILEECSRLPIGIDQCALVFAGIGWHRGVLGIVASRLVERFHRPTFVLSHSPDGMGQGSGRSIPIFHLLQALEGMPGLFVKFGGHTHAAGLTIASSRVDEFRERLNAYAAKLLTPDDFLPTLQADAEVELRELTEEAANHLLSLSPFGAGNPAPILVAREAVVVSQPSLMKEKHIRFNVTQGGRTIALKAWNFAHRIPELTLGAKIDIAFQVEEDSYSQARGYSGWCARLQDFRASG